MRLKPAGAMLGIALLFAALVMWSLWPTPRKNTKSQSTYNINPASKEESRTRGFSVADIKALIHEQEANSGQQADTDNAAVSERIQRFTLVLVIVNAVSALILLWYAYLTKRAADAATENSKTAKEGLELTREAITQNDATTKAQLAVAKESADAAKKSADTSRVALEVVERASIRAGIVDILNLPIGPTTKCRIAYSNAGRTHATFIRRHLYVTVLEALPEKPEYVADDSVGLTDHPLFPGDDLFFLGEAQLTNDQIADIASGAKTLFLYGFFEYRDVFKKTHKTGFGRRWDLREGKFMFVEQPGYNYAD